MGTIGENITLEVSYDKLFTGPTQATFQGVPWRLLSVSIQASATSWSTHDTTTAFSGEPAFFQVGLDSGQAVNIENMVSRRWLVNQVPITRTLRMTAPNPWKEDEQRKQSLCSFQNIQQPGASTRNSIIFVVAHFTFQFGAIPWTPVSKLHTVSHFRPSPASDSDSDMPSHCSMLSDGR